MKRAVIIATGQEEQLKALTEHRPSPLLKIAGKAIIRHVIEFLIQQGIDRFDLVLHHFPEQIEELLGNGERWGVDIEYHLVRDPNNPFATVRLPAAQWSEEQVLIGQGDFLPCENVRALLRESWSRPALIWDNGKWSGWGVIPVQQLNRLPADCRFDSFPLLLGEHHEVSLDKHAIGARCFREYQSSQQLVLDQEVKGLLLPTSCKQIRPQVWVSSSAQIHPNARLEAPVFVGENCQVKEDAQIGPYAVIEDHCIIDRQSQISHSTICHYSYVGEGLELKHCLVDRNVLISLTHDSEITVADDFILCGLNPPSIGSKLAHTAERIGAGLLLCASAPVLLPLLILCPQQQEEVVRLPSGQKEGEWETFSWMSLDSRWSCLRHLPSLFHIMRGEAHFVGLPPRSKSELRSLSSDWRNLYLRSRIGCIQLADLSGASSATEDELYSAEAYYTANRSVFYDLKLFFKYLGRRISLYT